MILQIRGKPIPSFKNSKMITRGRLITDPKKQRVMEEIIESFVSQLRFISQTRDDGTLTARQARSLIASLLPEDDSWDWIPELTVKAVECDKGHEGADIVVFYLDESQRKLKP